MPNYDEKVLASLIKTAAKTQLIWQKSQHFEYVTNRHWAVMVPKIEEMKVRVALYAAFGREIKVGETLTLAGGDVNVSDIDCTGAYLNEMNADSEVGTILPILLGPSESVISEVRIINFGSDLAAIPVEQADLVPTKTAYRVEGNRKGLIFLGDDLDVAVAPVLGQNWYDLIQKYVRHAAG